jgi:integrase
MIRANDDRRAGPKPVIVLIGQYTVPAPMPPTDRTPPAAGMTRDEKKHRDWINSTRPAKTLQGINTYAKQFVQWCTVNERQHLPATPLTAAEFMKYAAIDREEHRGPLSIATVEHAVRSAIANYHTMNGFVSPTRTDIVRDTITAIKRVGTPGPGGKEPLTVSMMRKVSQYFGCNISPINDRNRAMMLLGMSGLLRGGEIAALQSEDVWIESIADKPGQPPLRALFVFIAKSKTDQFRRGETVVVSEASDMKLCPVVAWEEWIGQRSKKHTNSTHLFYDMVSGGAITGATVNHILKSALSAVGIDPTEYGSHSLRKGGATAMAAANVEARLIKRHGRWRSDAVYVYITDSTLTRLNAAQSIFG